MLEGLQAGEELVDLSNAFEKATSDQSQEWRPGKDGARADNDESTS